jgi:solute carrier family 10 (sodium/bile acid cotransporter), member 7
MVLKSAIRNPQFRNYIPDPFIIGLFLMIFLAWLIPGIGMGEYTPNLGNIIDVGVFCIFFLYGLKLNPEKMRLGMRNWRMHLAIQLTTFLIFPLWILPFYPFFKGTEYEIFWMGMFFLAVLPSTVSSSVVMVSIAGGNIPGAIFNASISGLIGIAVTPLWMGLFLSRSTETYSLLSIIYQLVTQIILPVILGLLLHRYWGKWVNRRSKQLGWFDKSIILLIVYQSFSKSFLSGIFTSVNPLVFIVLLFSVILLFFTVFSLTGMTAKRLGFTREDAITLQFSGSKKSLVHGTVFANVLFSGISATGILLLPIMIYHAFQLFYISVVAVKKQTEIGDE